VQKLNRCDISLLWFLILNGYAISNRKKHLPHHHHHPHLKEVEAADVDMDSAVDAVVLLLPVQNFK